METNPVPHLDTDDEEITPVQLPDEPPPPVNEDRPPPARSGGNSRKLSARTTRRSKRNRLPICAPAIKKPSSRQKEKHASALRQRSTKSTGESSDSPTILPQDLPNHPSRDIIRLSKDELRTIFEAAPTSLTENPVYDKADPLSSVHDLRDTVANQDLSYSQTLQLTPLSALTKITDTPLEQLIKMANTNKSRLLEIVKQASKANEDLLPIEIDDSDDYQVLAAVLTWRAQ
ncbi:hypothetical protein FGB62_21g02 [Gracilaria domingensis]|nr:hypothetical protein FGB62_21g02 [Gracilaria domingensis]